MTIVVDGGWPHDELPWWSPYSSIWNEVDWWRWLAYSSLPSKYWGSQAVALLGRRQSESVRILAQWSLRNARARGLVGERDSLSLRAASIDIDVELTRRVAVRAYSNVNVRWKGPHWAVLQWDRLTERMIEMRHRADVVCGVSVGRVLQCATNRVFVSELDRDAEGSRAALPWVDDPGLAILSNAERVNAAFALREISGVVAVTQALGMSGERALELLDSDFRKTLLPEEVASVLSVYLGR